MAKYRKKPVVIEAEQFCQTIEPLTFWERLLCSVGWHIWYRMPDSKLCGRCGELYLKTLEGWLHVSDKDWIITGVKGEIYPCKPDIFEQTYELVEEQT